MSAPGGAAVKVVSWCVSHDRPYGWSQCSAGNDACDVRHFNVQPRRCDGCKWWANFLDGLGACGNEAFATCDDDIPPTTRADFYCKAWEAHHQAIGATRVPGGGSREHRQRGRTHVQH